MKRKVLIADDEPHILRPLKLVLQEAGYSVVSAEDGLEAYRKTEAIHPDLLILDIAMPKMDGYELYRRLQADPLKRRIPVIILTGLDGIESRFGCSGKGYPDIVTKPFSPYNLLDKVEEVFKGM